MIGRTIKYICLDRGCFYPFTSSSWKLYFSWQFVRSLLWPLTFSLHSHWSSELVPKWKFGAPAEQVEACKVISVQRDCVLNHYV